MTPILLLHLTTGQDIIGRATYDADSMSYVVENPVTPHVSLGQDGSMRVGLMPLRPYAPDVKKISVSNLAVVYMLPVDDRMEQAYQQYHSGLVLPETPTLSSLLKG